MNTTQIRCFLAVMETLNFTKAAEQLFISQPGLSRQIVSLERELNTLLFIRDKNGIRPTPAANVLVKELDHFETRIEDLVHKVQRAGQGYSESLTIGMLSGQFTSEHLTDRILKYMAKHPNVDLIFKQGSFKDLRAWIVSGDIDIAVTQEFDIQNMDGIQIRRFYVDNPVFAISRLTKTGQKEHITLEDLTEEALIYISPDDCRAGYELTHAFVKNHDLHFADVRYAPNLPTAMMWIETGQGVGIINHTSSIVTNSSIRLLEDLLGSQQDAYTCFAWKADNPNPAILHFTEM